MSSYESTNPTIPSMTGDDSLEYFRTFKPEVATTYGEGNNTGMYHH